MFHAESQVVDFVVFDDYTPVVKPLSDIKPEDLDRILTIDTDRLKGSQLLKENKRIFDCKNLIKLTTCEKDTEFRIYPKEIAGLISLQQALSKNCHGAHNHWHEYVGENFYENEDKAIIFNNTHGVVIGEHIRYINFIDDSADAIASAKFLNNLPSGVEYLQYVAKHSFLKKHADKLFTSFPPCLKTLNIVSIFEFGERPGGMRPRVFDTEKKYAPIRSAVKLPLGCELNMKCDFMRVPFGIAMG
jgi:hypothetical protein